MKTQTDKFTATEARHYAQRIASECSDCFSKVVARKFLGEWCVEINGGRGACYGKTASTVEDAEDIIRIFQNEAAAA